VLGGAKNTQNKFVQREGEVPMELKVTAFANIVCIVGIVGLMIANF